MKRSTLTILVIATVAGGGFAAMFFYDRAENERAKKALAAPVEQIIGFAVRDVGVEYYYRTHEPAPPLPGEVIEFRTATTITRQIDDDEFAVTGYLAPLFYEADDGVWYKVLSAKIDRETYERAMGQTSFLNALVRKVFAAPQGPLSGGTFASDASVGTLSWTNASNAQTSNDIRATVTLTDTDPQSQYLKATNFGFAIFSDSTINGIYITNEHSRGVITDGRNISDQAKLTKSAGFEGDSKTGASNYTDTDTTHTYGGGTDLWGTTWTASDVNDSGFGVGITTIMTGLPTPASGEARIDHITVTVYYTRAAHFRIDGAGKVQIDGTQGKVRVD